MTDQPRRTIAEQLDNATDGTEFAHVLTGFFALLDKARDEEQQR